mmetsp:Transcript_7702/g.24045  ORF Transcript_7702/g.24045 Transcript_7702/m.24045 type:complete len:210 (-) Transcript_7702:725-1354(-)
MLGGANQRACRMWLRKSPGPARTSRRLLSRLTRPLAPVHSGNCCGVAPSASALQETLFVQSCFERLERGHRLVQRHCRSRALLLPNRTLVRDTRALAARPGPMYHTCSRHHRHGPLRRGARWPALPRFPCRTQTKSTGTPVEGNRSEEVSGRIRAHGDRMHKETSSQLTSSLAASARVVPPATTRSASCEAHAGRRAAHGLRHPPSSAN